MVSSVGTVLAKCAQKPGLTSSSTTYVGHSVYICKPNTWEMETGEPEIQGRSGIHETLYQKHQQYNYNRIWAGRLAWWLRALADLLEDQGLIPSTHTAINTHLKWVWQPVYICDYFPMSIFYWRHRTVSDVHRFFITVWFKEKHRLEKC